MRFFFYSSAKAKDPVLVEALPGIGLVAYLAGAHLIRKFKAEKICDIISPELPNLTFIENGSIKCSINSLYRIDGALPNRDLIILFGNTQASSPPDQYKLYGDVLDLLKGMGCREVVTLGGLKRERLPALPEVHCTATNREALRRAVNLGARILRGRVFGAAGLLPGLAKLKGMEGLCALVDTLGVYPDAQAAQIALKFLGDYLGFSPDVEGIEETEEQVREFLSVGLGEKKRGWGII